MNRWLLAILAASFVTSAQAQQSPVVTVVTSPEPQTQAMAMVLTLQALQQGAEAHVLLCGPGGDLALRDAPASDTAPMKAQDVGPQALLTRAMAVGATVQVCALYLPNAGKGPDALMDGVSVATPPAMAERMLDSASRVWSF